MPYNLSPEVSSTEYIPNDADAFINQVNQPKYKIQPVKFFDFVGPLPSNLSEQVRDGGVKSDVFNINSGSHSTQNLSPDVMKSETKQNFSTGTIGESSGAAAIADSSDAVTAVESPSITISTFDPTVVNVNFDGIISHIFPPIIPVERGGRAGPKGITMIVTSTAVIPIPQQIVVDYRKIWESESTIDLDSTWGQAARTIIARKGKAATEMAFPTLAGGVKYKAQMTIDEKVRLLFTNIPFREFNFTVLLHPRNVGEAQAIEYWIKMVKMISAPDLKKGAAFWTYPGLFVINAPTVFPEWQTTGKQLFKTGLLACTNITVNYTPDGVWSQHRDGFPTAISVTLSFMETDFATRDRIDEGW